MISSLSGDGLDKLLIRNSSLKRADARVIARPAASVGQFDLQDAGLRSDKTLTGQWSQGNGAVRLPLVLGR